MFKTMKLKALAGLGLVGLVIMAGLLAWGFSWKADARWWQGEHKVLQVKHRKLVAEAKAVRDAARVAAKNPKLKWADTAQQVKWIGDDLGDAVAVIDIQTAKVNNLGLETARLAALNENMRKKAKVQIVKRDRVISRLESAALSPGERNDCARQLREAEAALDLVFKEGL